MPAKQPAGTVVAGDQNSVGERNARLIRLQDLRRAAMKQRLPQGGIQRAVGGDDQIAPMRERYEALIAQPARLEAILREGALKARAIATPKLARLRDAVGLGGGMGAADVASAVPAAPARAGKPPRLASFRDEQGRFRFRLFAGDGEELLLSRAFDDPKAAGAAQQRLKQQGADADACGCCLPVWCCCSMASRWRARRSTPIARPAMRPCLGCARR